MGSAERRGSFRGPWIGLLLVGAGLWGLYRLARPTPPHTIVVSPQTVSALAASYEQQQQRPPSSAELEALVDAWVDEELLVAEARAQGFDRADPIVRRRLAQKMRFALEDADALADPGDEVLGAFVQAHADAYRRPGRRGFSQVFVAGKDEAARARADALAQQLHEGADPTGLGDALAHGPRQAPASVQALADRYGDAFAQEVEAAPPMRWTVVASELGWHVIRIDRQLPGSLPSLAEVRARVLADWRVERRAAALARGLDELRTRYEVRGPP